MLRTLESFLAVFDAALIRVWQLGPADSCPTCAMRDECPVRTRCLHLEASVGVSTRLDGPFRRFPIGARRVGRAFAEQRTLIVRRDLEDLGLADGLWLERHRITGFAAIPLVRAGECVGVMAVFARRPLGRIDARALNDASRQVAAVLRRGTADDSHPPPVPLRSLAEIEREAIERTLAATGWRVSGPHGAAGILGLKPTTLHSRMLKLGVRRPAR